jgi:hypothetical protein
MNQKNPNEGLSEDVLQRFEAASLERMLSHLYQTVVHLEVETGGHFAGVPTRTMTLEDLNKMAQVFGLEPYILFRPRTVRYTGSEEIVGETTR